MRLIVAHKIFIGSAIALMAVLAFNRVLRYRATPEPGALAFAVVALIAIPLLALYLRRIWRR